jgi:serine/threonine protein kinase
VAILFLLLVAFIVVLLYIIRRTSHRSDDWEINYDELEIGEHLGSGGFGSVHRATWKGTEVAVKMLASDKVTKDMEKSFKDEVGVIPFSESLRVALYIAVSQASHRSDHHRCE